MSEVPAKPARPVRAHSITITAGADTHAGLIADLFDIISKLRQGIHSSVSGGASSGYVFEYIIDEAMTHERYMELLHTFLESERG